MCRLQLGERVERARNWRPASEHRGCLHAVGNLHASPFHCTRTLPPLSHATAPVSSISPSTAAWLHSPKHACASVNDTAILQRPKPPNVASGIRARKGYLRLATCKRRRSEFRQINDIVSWVEQHVLQRLRGTRESAVERASRTRERERARESNVPVAASDRWASVRAAAAVRLTGLQIDAPAAGISRPARDRASGTSETLFFII